MNAVIIYDKFDFAAEAIAMLERAAHRTDTFTKWSVKPWRVDMLKLPPAAEAALAEAVEAHLVLLAVRRVLSVFPWLVDWLERWATDRQIPDAAMAVWDGATGITRSSRATPELSQFAVRRGVSLLYDENAAVGDQTALSATNPLGPQIALPPTLHHTVEQPVGESYQHWGINE